MFNMKKSLVALAIGSAMVMPMTSSAAAVTYNLGNVTDIAAPVGGAYSALVFLGTVLDGGETYNFSLNAVDKSDLTISISELFGASIGNTYFSLKQGGTEINQIALAPLALASSNTYTFDDLSNGNYSLTLIPASIFTLRFGGQVNISATSVTAVPEPETNALMLVGLGMIGLIARRKFS